MTPAQKELKKKHGTPDEFKRAIWKAYSDLFITSAEAAIAINNYEIEWKEAGLGIKNLKQSQ